MFKMGRRASEVILDHQDDSVLIVSHMDADGISAAAIMSNALERLNIDHRVKFVKMLYNEVIEELELEKLTIFTDLGSSQLINLQRKFNENDVIIADHHKPQEGGWSQLTHFNAHLEGLNGAEEVSGAGIAYIIARELNPENKDLSKLALVGAIGDVQNAWGKLKGYNRDISKDGEEVGVVSREKDLLLYGRHTQPIFKSLQNLTDPPIPGVSNSVEGCVSMLKDLKIPYKTEDGYRCPQDLSNEEKQRLASELITRAITHVPEELTEYVPGLIIGEVHNLLDENEKSMLRGADEFSTCINSTARHEQPLIGYEVAMGNRDVYYRSMLKLLKYHRRCIAEGMNYIDRNGLEDGPEGFIQYFDASEVLKETFIGTITSLTIGHDKSDPYKPVIGIVKRDGSAKISARCSKLLFLKGLDMANAIREAAESVGGEGGGHAIACGARVDEDDVPEFIKSFEDRMIAAA